MFSADGSIRRRLELVLASVAAIVVGAVGAEEAHAAHETSLEESYVSAINDVRQEHGLVRLQPEGALVDAARSHSADMVQRGYFAHGSWFKRVLGAGAEGTTFGENLGWCSVRVCPGGSPRLLIQRWLASPEHRANLLQPRFRRLGVGVARGRFENSDSVVVTTDFDG